MANALKKALLSAVVFVLAFAGFIGSAQAASAAQSGTDGVAAGPASAGKPDLSRVHFEYEVNPSQPAKDSIYVVNPSTTTQDVTIYARDAFSDTKGDFLIQNFDQTPTDVGAWVKFYDGSTVFKKTLKPKEFVTIPFQVSTPAGAIPGDHIGAIVASSVSAGSNINVVKRVAVRLYAHVLGQAHAHLDVTLGSLSVFTSLLNPFDSIEQISYTVKNTGNVELSAEISAQPTTFNL